MSPHFISITITEWLNKLVHLPSLSRNLNTGSTPSLTDHGDKTRATFAVVQRPVGGYLVDSQGVAFRMRVAQKCSFLSVPTLSLSAQPFMHLCTVRLSARKADGDHMTAVLNNLSKYLLIRTYIPPFDGRICNVHPLQSTPFH